MDCLRIGHLYKVRQHAFAISSGLGLLRIRAGAVCLGATDQFMCQADEL
jgi:hypothetical protein